MAIPQPTTLFMSSSSGNQLHKGKIFNEKVKGQKVKGKVQRAGLSLKKTTSTFDIIVSCTLCPVVCAISLPAANPPQNP
jgi:hypothetical protein